MRWKEYAIVDDNRFDRLICNKILQRIDASLRIQEFQTGREILDYLIDGHREGDELLILLDLNMPEMSGYDFLEALKVRPDLDEKMKDIKIIIITSSTRDEDRKQSLSFPNVLGFLQKPLMTSALQKLIDNH